MKDCWQSHMRLLISKQFPTPSKDMDSQSCGSLHLIVWCILTTSCCVMHLLLLAAMFKEQSCCCACIQLGILMVALPAEGNGNPQLTRADDSLSSPCSSCSCDESLPGIV